MADTPDGRTQQVDTYQWTHMGMFSRENQCVNRVDGEYIDAGEHLRALAAAEQRIRELEERVEQFHRDLCDEVQGYAELAEALGFGDEQASDDRHERILARIAELGAECLARQQAEAKLAELKVVHEALTAAAVEAQRIAEEQHVDFANIVATLKARLNHEAFCHDRAKRERQQAEQARDAAMRELAALRA